jgi:hypothetical protein
MHSRREILKSNWKDYQKASKKERKELLDRLVPVTGLNRSYLATALGNYSKKGEVSETGAKGTRKQRPAGKRGGRRVKYDEGFTAVLAEIWSDFGKPCGKLLVPMIHEMIDFLEGSKQPDYGITPATKRLLLEVSAAQADILLKPSRKALEIRGVSTTRTAHTPLRSHIPVQTHFDRDMLKPGQFAFDTVAHCGASASGQFNKTLTGTDICSGWTEERPLLNAANRWVQEAITDIQTDLPFPMTGAHYDNGMEFINEPLLKWRVERHITATRTRPDHKNDNCYAGQKNYDAARKTVGCFRFDTEQEHAAPAEACRWLCPLRNYWVPSFRLTAKEKQADGRCRKIYEKHPRTPFERPVESPDVSPECKSELLLRRSLQNPAGLNRRLNEAVARLLKTNREKLYRDDAPCQGDGQAPAA